MINWNDAPEWANYVAQDKDGDWWWYEDKPVTRGYSWGFDSGDCQKVAIAISGWKESLQERPHD